MQAEYNGIRFDGTPEEILQMLRLMGKVTEQREKTRDKYNDLLRKMQLDQNQQPWTITWLKEA